MLSLQNFAPISKKCFAGLLLAMTIDAGAVLAIAPIEIEVPLPRCENGKPRDANQECPGDDDGIFRLDQVKEISSPRRDDKARGSGRNIENVRSHGVSN
jgi:hypothetical protein